MEMARDLAHLLVAASSLIQMNAAMSEKLLVAQQTAEDAQVQVFYKDMEIHELNETITMLKENAPDE
jgi:hypothetical protein